MDKDKICLELINYCRSNQRVAPKLNKWALLLELIDPARSNESLSIPYYDWEQVGALVHWLVLEAQIKHAYENGLIDEVTKFLIELKEDDWDHIDDGGIRSDEVKQPSGGRLTVLIIDIHRYRILTTTWDGGYLNDQFNDLIRSEFDPREEEKQLIGNTHVSIHWDSESSQNPCFGWRFKGNTTIYLWNSIVLV